MSFLRPFGNLKDTLTNLAFVVAIILAASWLVSGVIYRTAGDDSAAGRAIMVEPS
jgi:hypothetical protein